MPITLACPCGKPLRVGDQHAGKLVKCPICGATQRASHAVAVDPHSPNPPKPPRRPPETSDDFEVIEETIPATKPVPPKPSPAPSTPRSEDSPQGRGCRRGGEARRRPGITGEPKKPKKKRKKKARTAGEDDDGNYLDRMRENEAWVKRMIRGSAYIVVGVAILIGVGIIYSQYWEDRERGGGQGGSGRDPLWTHGPGGHRQGGHRARVRAVSGR